MAAAAAIFLNTPSVLFTGTLLLSGTIENDNTPPGVSGHNMQRYITLNVVELCQPTVFV